MIAEDEWLVVIDRQKVFAESEWSAWACADGTYYDTNEAFEKLAKLEAGRQSSMFDDHPASEARAQHIRDRMKADGIK